MSRVLLLNATYEPICTVVLGRAIALMLQGKAQLVERRPGAALHSATAVLDYPTVIRLERYVRLPYRRTAPLTRVGVLRRDGFACVYCGKEGHTIDHIVPRSRGGASSWLNLAACCQKCNNKKGDRLLGELGWRLKFQPYEPDYRSFAATKLASRYADPTWDGYLMQSAA